MRNSWSRCVKTITGSLLMKIKTEFRKMKREKLLVSTRKVTIIFSKAKNFSL
jgi:hypothetical protein